MEYTRHEGCPLPVTTGKDESVFREVYFLSNKEAENVANLIDTHVRTIRTQTGNKVKTLRTHNGTEFVNTLVEEVLKKKGIVHETTIPYTPEENGALGRDNRTIVQKARTMLHVNASLPWKLWAEWSPLQSTCTIDSRTEKIRYLRMRR
jgi:transposase InsO family protein